MHARRWSTLATVLGIALVVGVFCSLLSLADGLRRALLVTADAHNVIVLAEGATAESSSSVSNAEAARLWTVPDVARDASGQPLVSCEVIVQTSVTRRGDRSETTALAAVRGVDLEAARAVHDGIKLVAGRWFQVGRDEVTVGQTAAARFHPGRIGQELACGGRTFEIVGVFSAGGGAHESEYWGYISNVQAAYQRDRYSSVVVRLDTTDATAAAAAIDWIGAGHVALHAMTEPAYFGTQMSNARVVQGLALLVVAIMGVGAVFAAMNTMYTALAGRTREIGMLRAIGFPKATITIGLIAESTAIALIGGVLGCVASAVLVLALGTSDLVGTQTFTSVAFAMRPSPPATAVSLGVAVTIGVLGGVWPARRAVRTSIVQTLRVA